jgi:GNAT superfamily N-acetyltransferase
MSLASTCHLTPSNGGPRFVAADVDRDVPGSDSIVMRALRPGDQDLLVQILQGLGPQSRTQRFLAPRPRLSERDLASVTRVDVVRHGGVIAFLESTHRPIAAAHYLREDDAEVAETAIEVVDDWQQRGVGRLLVTELCAHALQAGIRRFEWFAFESNPAVGPLAQNLRDCRRVHVGNGVVKWSAAIG